MLKPEPTSYVIHFCSNSLATFALQVVSYSHFSKSNIYQTNECILWIYECRKIPTFLTIICCLGNYDALSRLYFWQDWLNSISVTVTRSLILTHTQFVEKTLGIMLLTFLNKTLWVLQQMQFLTSYPPAWYPHKAVKYFMLVTIEGACCCMFKTK